MGGLRTGDSGRWTQKHVQFFQLSQERNCLLRQAAEDTQPGQFVTSDDWGLTGLIFNLFQNESQNAGIHDVTTSF